MTTLTAAEIDKMPKAELHKAAKARNIKYGKLSLLQIREALKASPGIPEKAVKAKKKADGPREGSKMEKALVIYNDNKSGSRAELLKLFQTKAGLTKAGANTYLGVIKKKYK